MKNLKMVHIVKKKKKMTHFCFQTDKKPKEVIKS